MTALGLLAVALLGAAPLDAAAPAATAHVHAVITPARPHLVLGDETEMTLEIEVRDNEGGVTFVPERALASIGTIASVTASGDDHFVARYVAPSARFPQAAIIVVDLAGGGQHLRATTCLPLYAAAQMPFHTSANASVAVRIESQTFGPVRADAQGNVTIPIVVPPGVRDGLARATDQYGNTRETTVDLQPAPFTQMLIVAAPQLEVGSFSEVSTFGVTTRGEPIAQGATTLRASEGMVHPLGSGAAGEERFLIEAPQKVGSGAMHLAASAVDVAPEPLLVLEKRVEAVIPLVAAPAERLTLLPSTDHLIIGDDAGATVTVEARDRHDNPASCDAPGGDGRRPGGGAEARRRELRPAGARRACEAEPARQHGGRGTARRAPRAHVHPRDARPGGAPGGVGVVAGNRRRRQAVGRGAHRRVRQDRKARCGSAADLAGGGRPRRPAARAPARQLQDRLHAQPHASAPRGGAGRAERPIAERHDRGSGRAAARAAHGVGAPGPVHQLRSHGGSDRHLRGAARDARPRATPGRSGSWSPCCTTS